MLRVKGSSEKSLTVVELFLDTSQELPSQIGVFGINRNYSLREFPCISGAYFLHKNDAWKLQFLDLLTVFWSFLNTYPAKSGIVGLMEQQVVETLLLQLATPLLKKK